MRNCILLTGKIVLIIETLMISPRETISMLTFFFFVLEDVHNSIKST